MYACPMDYFDIYRYLVRDIPSVPYRLSWRCYMDPLLTTGGMVYLIRHT